MRVDFVPLILVGIVGTILLSYSTCTEEKRGRFTLAVSERGYAVLIYETGAFILDASIFS